MSGNAADVITGIRDMADAMVRKVNPGCDYTGPWFAPKVAETAEAMTRKVCLDLKDKGRADLARLIRIAWERTA
jgi:hypothetical protein